MLHCCDYILPRAREAYQKVSGNKFPAMIDLDHDSYGLDWLLLHFSVLRDAWSSTISSKRRVASKGFRDVSIIVQEAVIDKFLLIDFDCTSETRRSSQVPA